MLIDCGTQEDQIGACGRRYTQHCHQRDLSTARTQAPKHRGPHGYHIRREQALLGVRVFQPRHEKISGSEGWTTPQLPSKEAPQTAS